jgi:hypothetical protein
MGNGEFILNELDFEKQIEGMDSDSLLRFVARQSYQIKLLAEQHNKILNSEGGICDRMKDTERKQRDNRALIVALWVVVASVASALIYLFLNHMSSAKDALLGMLHNFI